MMCGKNCVRLLTSVKLIDSTLSKKSVLNRNVSPFTKFHPLKLSKAGYSHLSRNLKITTTVKHDKFSSVSDAKFSYTLSTATTSNKIVDESDPAETVPPLTKENAHALVMKLTTDERDALMTVLQEFQSEDLKAEYKGQLAAFRWRSKFGRPTSLPRLGDVDPTGSYCTVPEDWLLRKYEENPATVPKPTTPELIRVGIHNACPFIGFGFLDNFFMIICGDYIDMSLGSVITLSTMAAAALGNTLSDVLGIGSAVYVEWTVAKFGFRPPNLSPIQLDMTSSRLASNIVSITYFPRFV
ncbi:uncharacterized protein LOC111064413 [Nilaparvata lugens]|uniref:uncharacterized protein LOC111064413 n=1 Tax=Nilaparvata lugens TaxID=108931 RepID=UPI00193D4179|nr:uncharacterized protein LOC111064413 [Nilaparvata lugens]